MEAPKQRRKRDPVCRRDQVEGRRPRAGAACGRGGRLREAVNYGGRGVRRAAACSAAPAGTFVAAGATCMYVDAGALGAAWHGCSGNYDSSHRCGPSNAGAAWRAPPVKHGRAGRAPPRAAGRLGGGTEGEELLHPLPGDVIQ